MRVLLAFALLLGFSLTATASAATLDAECAVVETVYADAATLMDADFTAATVELLPAEQARDLLCVAVIIDFYDEDGGYIGSAPGLLCVEV